MTQEKGTNSPFWKPLKAAINSHPKGHLFSIYFFLSCPSLDRSYQALPVIEAQKRAGDSSQAWYLSKSQVEVQIDRYSSCEPGK